MSDLERLEKRLKAVEQTVVDGDFELDELADLAQLSEDISALESRLASLEERLAEVEATTQSMDGYVSRVESVNDGVEKQADAAIAAVNRLEHRIENVEHKLDATAAESNGADDEPATPEPEPTQTPDGLFSEQGGTAQTTPSANGDEPSQLRTNWGDSNENGDDGSVMESASTTNESLAAQESVPENGQPNTEVSPADQESIEQVFSQADSAEDETQEGAGFLASLMQKLR